ncbi:MAG: wax ester/triacylglycerol synthase domain-containing protein [Pseudomonadota bacterium]
MERMRPDDHFMVIVETDATPMHIGALILLELPEKDRSSFSENIRSHLTAKLRHTPLLRILKESPQGYDSDAWFSVPEQQTKTCFHVHHHDETLDEGALRGFIANACMKRINLSAPPFEIHIFDNISSERAALYLKVHHCVTDGVGFQRLLDTLSDNPTDGTEPICSGYAEPIPSPNEWLREAEAKFESQKSDREEAKSRKLDALEALKTFNSLPGHETTATPEFELSGPTSTNRAYRTLSIPLRFFKNHAKTLDAKINDLFLWVAATAVRDYLNEENTLPKQSLSVNSARSYRINDHGQYGNRIVALRPKLATNVEDAIDRLREIQKSMRLELQRSEIEQRLLDQPEKPFGAARRREQFGKRTKNQDVILAGNITLSNVPGSEKSRFFCGYRQLANYPVPLLGSGRFLNITSRRNEGYLDWGIMADPEKVRDIDRLVVLIESAIEQLGCLARSHEAETIA